jgi:hypothetical protein
MINKTGELKENYKLINLKMRISVLIEYRNVERVPNDRVHF